MKLEWYDTRIVAIIGHYCDQRRSQKKCELFLDICIFFLISFYRVHNYIVIYYYLRDYGLTVKL